MRMSEKLAAKRRLSDRLKEAFEQSPYKALRRVEYELENDEVTLHGELPTYFLKQMASSCAAKAARGRRIVNRIRVVDPDWRRSLV
jgi:osmotically-inducible protein OsmY